MKRCVFQNICLLFVVLNASINVCGQNTIDEAIEKYNSGTIPYILVEELQSELAENEKIVLLDTRSREEYEVSHLKNAKWIGYKKFDEQNLQDIDNNAEIVVYCSVGVRSEKIGEELKDLGFKNIRNLYGGIFLWTNKGHPIYKDGKQTDEIHTYNKRWESYITKGKKIN